MNIKEIRQILLAESEEKYRKFSSTLIPNIDNVLGVRLPKLRKFAKEIYAKNDWQNFISCTKCQFMEEIMLQGMVIGLIKDNPQKILEYIKNFVPYINNWAVCDTFCNSLKFTQKNKDLVWNFIQPYFYSKNEYELRFAFVMIIEYFINEEYLEKIFVLSDKFSDTRYYAKMAVAWALSICFINFPDRTIEYLKVSKLDNWTFNKTIQKIRESMKVDKKTKEYLLKNFKRA